MFPLTLTVRRQPAARPMRVVLERVWRVEHSFGSHDVRAVNAAHALSLYTDLVRMATGARNVPAFLKPKSITVVTLP